MGREGGNSGGKTVIVAAFVKDGKAYFVTLDGDIFEVAQDGDDYTVEKVGDLSSSAE